MAKKLGQISQTKQMLEYAKQLKRHSKDRTALVIQLSALEKQFQASYYRQLVAQHLRKLVARFADSRMFGMPNADSIIILNGAKPDDIEPTLIQIRRELSDSMIVKNLDPVQCTSDAFIGWYPLERDYKFFIEIASSYTNTGAAPLRPAAPRIPRQNTGSDSYEKTSTSSPSMRKGTRTVTIEMPDAQTKRSGRALDTTSLRQLIDGLKTVDVSNLLRRQQVMAVVKGGQAPVFTTRFIPLDVVREILLPDVDIESNLWFRGYIMEFLSERILASGHSMGDAKTMAASIHVSAASVVGQSFDIFDKGIGNTPRSQFIIEMSLSDMLEDPVRFKKAADKLGQKGFKFCINEIEPLAFLLMKADSMKADFVKIRLRNDSAIYDFSASERRQMIEMVSKIGREHVILSGVDDQKSLREGTSLGITLFQGQAISPITK